MKPLLSFLFIIIFVTSNDSKAQYAVGDTAINFVLPDTAGNAISLQDYDGDVILLNFFASWCVPCSIEAPQLQDSIWSVFRNQGFTLIGIDFQEPLYPLLNFINFYNLTFPIVRDTAGTVFNDYGLIVLPSNVLINQRGMIIWSEPGFDIPVMKSLIDSLLNISSVSNSKFKTIPQKINLISNYPNPFNSQTNIKMQLYMPSLVHLKIYESTGKFVKQISQKFAAGINSINVNMSGQSNGVYFYSIAVENEKVFGKFLLYK